MATQFVKLSSKNQLTLPRSIVKHFPGMRYFEIAERNNEVVLRPARMVVHGDALERVREKIRDLGLSEEMVAEAVKSVRKAK
ncbi:MAG: hypothetical protein PHC61_07885 [Chitinivibrionales bacterium]|nr:hypothetical protein [Chitinivibrionales bacterium]